jgi:hypothetical protein
MSKTCKEVADAFREWGRYYFEHNAQVQCGLYTGMADALDFFGDTPAPEALLKKYDRLFDPRIAVPKRGETP